MRYRDLIDPCALELVIHQICSKLCLPRLFLFRAVNATWGHGNFSAGYISAFNLCFSRIYAYIGQRNGDRTLKNMTPQPDSSSSASVPSLKHRSKSSLLCSSPSEARFSWRFWKVLEKTTSTMEFSLDLHSMLGNYREASFITFIRSEPRNIHFFLPFPP